MSPLLSDALSLAEKLGGKPKVLFTIAIGARMWRYAQAARNVTVAASGLTYYAAKIQVDGDVERKNETGPTRIPVKMAIRLDVVAAMREIQTEPMYLGIHRYHASAGGLPARWAYGEIASVGVTRGWCHVELETDEAAWEREIPRATFGPQCQWSPYTPECGVNAEDFKFETTITDIDRSVIEVASVDGHADGYYSQGIAKVGNSLVHIGKHTGTTLRLFGALPTGTVVTDAITLYAGDDLTKATCKTTFNNLDAFMGFPWMPDRDPMKRLAEG